MYFQLFQDVQLNWRWRLRSANHRIIADSGESYINRQDCLSAIILVMDTNRNTPVNQ
ncbi:MAG: DUF1508 domain-containing protein [Bacteroidetes bacterium]|nr:DUF1508 domain-containing protein [Bacteroidota bacterium]